MTNFQIARLLLTSPTKAFAALKETSVFALPMWLALIGTALVEFWYASTVDVRWLQDQLLTSMHIRPTAQQLAAAAAPGARHALMLTGVIGPTVGILAVAALCALYFLLAGSLTKVRYSYRQWFAFIWWAATPNFLALIAAVLILAFSHTTQIATGSLQPLTLNELVFHRSLGEPGYSMLSNFGLVQLIEAWVAYLGLRVWSGRSVVFCLVLILLPMVLVYGVWALVSFR